MCVCVCVCVCVCLCVCVNVCVCVFTNLYKNYTHLYGDNSYISRLYHDCFESLQ